MPGSDAGISCLLLMKRSATYLSLVFLIFAPFVFQARYSQNVLILILLYVVLGSAWNILGGFAGQLSLGHAAFFGIGAYTTTLLFIDQGISPWIGMLIGGLASVVI